MTQEQYKRACRIQDELINLNKMLYGFGNAKLIQINSINIYQREKKLARLYNVVSSVPRII